MSLNERWRRMIEAGPIEPPLLTVDYKMAEMQFNVWDAELTLGEKLLPILQKTAAALRVAFSGLPG